MILSEKLQKLKDILEIANRDTFSQKDFLDAFAKVMEVFKGMKEANAKELESIKAMIFSMTSEMQKKNTEMSDTTKQKMMDYCMSEMDKMMKDWEVVQKKHDAKMQVMDKKMSEVVNGKDADEEKVKQEVLAELTPKIPKIEDIEKDLPKLREPIRNALESFTDEDEKTKISAIGYLRKELDELRDLIRRSGVVGGGGGVVGGGNFSSHLDVYDLSSQTNGVLKTFPVPGMLKPYLLISSDFPTVLILNNGFTYDATANTITLTTVNAPSAGSQLGLLHSL